jgi:hypothetical protein
MSNIDDWMSGGTKVPAFKFDTVGDAVVGVVLDASVMQCRDYRTNELEWWDDAKTQPKEQLVVTLQTSLNDGGEDDGQRRIYAKKPGEMLTAVHGVTLGTGKPLRPGGRLAVKFTGERPHENPRFNAVKLYEAAYEAPAGAGVDDLLSGNGAPAGEIPVAAGTAAADLL